MDLEVGLQLMLDGLAQSAQTGIGHLCIALQIDLSLDSSLAPHADHHGIARSLCDQLAMYGLSVHAVNSLKKADTGVHTSRQLVRCSQAQEQQQCVASSSSSRRIQAGNGAGQGPYRDFIGGSSLLQGPRHALLRRLWSITRLTTCEQ